MPPSLHAPPNPSAPTTSSTTFRIRKTGRARTGRALILKDMFRFAVALTLATASALAAAQAQAQAQVKAAARTQPGGERR